MTLVKICGLTNPGDALAAAEAGADMLGFVFAASPRRVSPQTAREIIRALPRELDTVGVFVDETPERINDIARFCGLRLIQLHGSETPGQAARLAVPFMKAFRTKDAGILSEIAGFGVGRLFLLDSYDPAGVGGTGAPVNLRIAAEAARLGRAILAGGLAPDNVARAMAIVRPFGVDVCSGVECSPGNKDSARMREFVSEVRRCIQD
ncbi:MAG: phosphoribosylanthranilate isomerase [Planctomycetota bacterium]|nr:phosphoribosylanthranilate isomerase [Planctomycetota bacterium]